LIRVVVTWVVDRVVVRSDHLRLRRPHGATTIDPTAVIKTTDKFAPQIRDVERGASCR
jgi:hypothetical protein